MTTRRLLRMTTLLLIAVGAAPLMATYVWDSRSAALRMTLDRLSVPSPHVFAAADLVADELPAPVERFFRHVLPEGQPIVRAVHLVTDGEMLTGDDGWRPFTALQRFSTTPPGFVWDARLRMAPLLPVYVRDAYVGTHTEMRGRVLGLFRVVNDTGTPGLASGQLMRYLAETIWFPTALLPRHHPVSWQPIDEHRALATLTDRGLNVSLEFRFTPDGDVAEVYSPIRTRAIDDRYVPTPWAVSYSDFQIREGLRIPLWCEAEWRLPGGPLPYWRGRVTSIRYEHSR